MCVPFAAILGSHTARTESRTKVNEGSKDVLPVWEVPFSGPVDDLNTEGVGLETPQKTAKFLHQRGISMLKKHLE